MGAALARSASVTSLARVPEPEPAPELGSGWVGIPIFCAVVVDRPRPPGESVAIGSA